MRVRFMTLVGKFAVSHEEEFSDEAAAMQAVRAHADRGGYTHVQCILDVDTYRYTARTPHGRSGRNIAYCDIDG